MKFLNAKSDGTSLYPTHGGMQIVESYETAAGRFYEENL
jgi:hypothetical protein